MDKFIVAEISKTWDGNFDENTPMSPLLAQKFETVINNNFNRGYNLQGWQFSNTFNTDRLQLVETIIAVFILNDNSPGNKTKRIKLNHGTATVDENCPQKTIDILNDLSDKAYNMASEK